MITLENIRLNKNGKNIVSVNNLHIESGQMIGVIGPNGAGKSSLIKIMALLEKPTSGMIKLKGKQVFPGNITLNERRKFSVVFQQPFLLDTTVFHNVAIGLKFRRISRKEIEKTVYYWLEQFGISGLANERAKFLSGGEAQRVSLARALATNPEVLFLDEPFSALDLPTRRKLLKDFKDILKHTKMTIIFISHDYQEIKYLCEEVILMYEGNVIMKKRLDDLANDAFPPGLSQFLYDWMTPL